MDDLDRKIIQLMVQNARMPVKEIAQKINLTSPAVSSRIHRLEQEGVIGGYTVLLHPESREAFLSMIAGEPDVLQCYRVTGSYNFTVKVSCAGIDELEHLLTRIQTLGTTNTQIVLSTQLDRPLSL